MSSTAIALVIGGALLHAVWNLFAKKASGGIPFIWLYGVVSLACAVPVGIFVSVHNQQALTSTIWSVILASAAVHLLYSIVLQKGYKNSDFSVVYPMARGTGPLFSVFSAVLLLGEMPGVCGWLGIFSILAGIMFISGLPQFFRKRGGRLAQGVLLGAATGAAVAAYTVIDGYAVKVLGISPLLYYILSLGFRTLLLAPLALRSPLLLKEQWGENRWYIIAVGVLSPLAYTLVLYAMKLAPLSYVAPLRELSMLVGVFIGAHVLREKFVFSRLVGAALMVMGVVLLVNA